MTIAIVDRLKPVQIDHHDSKRAILDRGLLGDPRQMCHGVSAVEKPGQRVSDRRLQPMSDVAAQPIRQTLGLHDFADPESHFFGVKTIDHHILRPQIQRVPLKIACRAVQHHQNR